jgi:hypothetical protein
MYKFQIIISNELFLIEKLNQRQNLEDEKITPIKDICFKEKSSKR